MARKKIGELLVEAGVLGEDGLRRALSEQRRWGGAIGRILVDLKLLSEVELVQGLSAQLGLPSIDLDRTEIHPTVLDLVPGEVAEQYNVVPFAQPMKFLDVAMAEPTNLGVIDELRIRTQLNIRPYLAGPKMIERALAKHYRRGFGRVLRRDTDIPIDTDDVIAPAGARGRSARPSTADIDAARRREGLAPAQRPSRPHVAPAPLDTPLAPPPGLESIALPALRDAEIDALQDRISALEALVARDEEVLRKLLALLVEKGVATREEILERIR